MYPLSLAMNTKEALAKPLVVPGFKREPRGVLQVPQQTSHGILLTQHC